MNQLKVLSNFDNDTDSDLVIYGTDVVTNMTGNAHFPTPNPTLASLTTMVDTLRLATAAARNGGVNQREDRDVARQALEGGLFTLGNYVEDEANGNRQVALTSGLRLNKEHNEPKPPLVPVEGLKAADTGNPGELKVSFKAQESASSYLVFFGFNPQSDADFQMMPTTTSKVVLTGLPSAQVCTIKVCAIGPRGQRMWSQPITRVVQ